MTATVTATAGTAAGATTRGRSATTYDDPPSADLFQRLSVAPDRLAEQDLVDEIVRLHLPAARVIACRYRDRGIPTEDLMQVAALGLVKAVRRYDCARGTGFMAYAVPTITGEVKRHFRDSGWLVRPTRRLQELRLRVGRATEHLSQDLNRAPTMNELAAHLGTTVDDVLEALACGGGYRALSLDAPPDGDDGRWADLVPETDTALAGTPDRVALQAMLADLPPRDRTILAMRFFGDMTQTQIGVEVGVSQMQVSRLISLALRRLRAGMESEPAGRGGG